MLASGTSKGRRWRIVKKLITFSLVAAIGVLGLAVATYGTSAARPGFVFPAGCCFYEGSVVRTVVPPASTPQEGVDNFYGVSGGVAGQKGVVAVAPGDTNYHGGHWAFHSVTWNVAPYLLTSEAAVLAAEALGDVSVTRDPSKDFLCPIQP